MVDEPAAGWDATNCLRQAGSFMSAAISIPRTQPVLQALPPGDAPPDGSSGSSVDRIGIIGYHQQIKPDGLIVFLLV